jgi:hypothetical protein
MRIFQLETLGTADPDLVMLEEEPVELGLKAHCAAVGKPIADVWPRDARMQLAEENPGVTLTPLLGNTVSYLIVDRATSEIILRHCAGVPLEILPFTLLDHRGRVHSRDYVVLNPLGSRDCVDARASDIDYFEGQVAGINTLVLDPAKLEGAPALFRLAQERQRYLVQEGLAAALAGLRNVVLREVPVSPVK